MRKKEVQVGLCYWAKVSGRMVPILLTSELSAGRGWQARNLLTDRTVRIRTAARLKRLVSQNEPIEARRPFEFE